MSEQIATGSNDLHTGQTIRTFKGHYVNVFDPDPATIDIDDIAHALSHVCRFGGHTKVFYSVADHSLRVMRLCSIKNKLAALLHDAAEAYMCDMPRPIKRNLPEYKVAEITLMQVIATKFNLEWPLPAEIKGADSLMLELEHDALMKYSQADAINFDVLSPYVAKKEFLQAYDYVRHY